MITAAQRERILQLRQEGLSTRQIAAAVGVSADTVSRHLARPTQLAPARSTGALAARRGARESGEEDPALTAARQRLEHRRLEVEERRLALEEQKLQREEEEPLRRERELRERAVLDALQRMREERREREDELAPTQPPPPPPDLGELAQRAREEIEELAQAAMARRWQAIGLNPGGTLEELEAAERETEAEERRKTWRVLFGRQLGSS